ncbi:DUF4307 domain-containing protein [Thermoactinospora rubra]|uniref:DUF4307 domain-containing protein n=1 Tax=Thermoactinospora rubra TaxID=1088767 RepID=UPI000A110636|nr:DUF4307 domain-containing protein [Thermoactinospora rubra]
MATRDVGDGPVLGTPDDYPDDASPPARRGRLVVHLVIGVLVAIVAGGWGWVMWTATGNSGVPAQVVTFTVKDAAKAEITFTVSKPEDRAAVCRIRALDVNHVEVGSKEVTIPAGEGMKQLKESVSTSAQATSVHIQHCDLV